MSKNSSFKDIENKQDVRRGKDSMKKNCESLRRHVMNRQTNKQKELLTNKQMELYKNAKKFTTFGKNILKTNILKMQNVVKIEIIVIIQVNTEALHIVHVI